MQAQNDCHNCKLVVQQLPKDNLGKVEGCEGQLTVFPINCHFSHCVHCYQMEHNGCINELLVWGKKEENPMLDAKCFLLNLTISNGGKWLGVLFSFFTFLLKVKLLAHSRLFCLFPPGQF